jgi:serine/threonine-protein kinase
MATEVGLACSLSDIVDGDAMQTGGRRVCPACGATYSDSAVQFCDRDGAPLAVQPAGSADPLIGKSVAGRYRVVERIGRGGMGTVYRARQLAMDRDIALKVLRPEIAADPTVQARFAREARAASQIKSVRVVTLMDYGHTEEGLYFIAMELLEGETLAARIAREGRLPPPEALRIAGEIARALEVAHEEGVVHRDLKPDNVIVTARERAVKVLDFGIAKMLAAGDGAPDPAMTVAGAMLGTPMYMSPEAAARRGEVGPAADLYSLGVMLFEMLAGRLPFEEREPVLLLGMHMRARPPLLRAAAPGLAIPEQLEQLVDRLLDKKADERPTATATVAQLQTLSAQLAAPTGLARWTESTDVDALRETPLATVQPAGLESPSVLPTSGFVPAAPDKATPAASDSPVAAPKLATPSTAGPLFLELSGTKPAEPAPLVEEDDATPLPPAASNLVGTAEDTDGESTSRWPALARADGYVAPAPTASAPAARHLEPAALTPTSATPFAVASDIESAPRRGPRPRWVLPAAGGLALAVAATLWVAIDAASSPATGPEPPPAPSLGSSALRRTSPAPATEPGTSPTPSPGAAVAPRPPVAPTSPPPTPAPPLPSGADPGGEPVQAVSAAEGSTGFLTVETTPRSRVRLDGRELGVTPIRRREISAGIHRLTLTSMASAEAARVPKQRRITIVPGQVTTINDQLAAPPAGPSIPVPGERLYPSGHRRVPVE